MRSHEYMCVFVQTHINTKKKNTYICRDMCTKLVYIYFSRYSIYTHNKLKYKNTDLLYPNKVMLNKFDS